MATPEPSIQLRPERHAPMRELPLWTVLCVSGLVLVIGLRDDGRPGGTEGDSVDVAGGQGAVTSIIARAGDQALGQGPDSPQFVDVSGADGRSAQAGTLGSQNQGAGDRQGDLGPGADGAKAPSAGTEVWQPQPRSRPGAGAPSEEGSFTQGIRTGDWVVRWPNGETHSAGRYEQGLRDGLWRSYSMTGALVEDVTYQDGALEGAWRSYALGGEVLGEGQHDDNHRTGTWTLRYTDGRIKERGNYVDGLREGDWEFYDDLGLPTTRSGHYRAGVKID